MFTKTNHAEQKSSQKMLHEELKKKVSKKIQLTRLLTKELSLVNNNQFVKRNSGLAFA